MDKLTINFKQNGVWWIAVCEETQTSGMATSKIGAFKALQIPLITELMKDLTKEEVDNYLATL